MLSISVHDTRFVFESFALLIFSPLFFYLCNLSPRRKYLGRNQVPEWRTRSLNYKRLKKLLIPLKESANSCSSLGSPRVRIEGVEFRSVNAANSRSVLRMETRRGVDN